MRFSITTDYAIRIIGYLILQDRDRVSTAKEMAEQLGIPYHYFIKIAARLKLAGYIQSIQGPAGGYRPADNASDITLYDIIRTMEGDICINRCLDKDQFCSRYIKNDQVCPIHEFFESFQNDMIATLKGKRISEVWKAEK